MNGVLFNQCCQINRCNEKFSVPAGLKFYVKSNWVDNSDMINMQKLTKIVFWNTVWKEWFPKNMYQIGNTASNTYMTFCIKHVFIQIGCKSEWNYLMSCNVWPLDVDQIIFGETIFRIFFLFREIRSIVFWGGGSHLIQMLLKVGQKGWHGNFNKGKVDGLTVNPIFISITTDFSGRFTIIWLDNLLRLM